MFDWVGPDWTLGTFKQTISTSCLKSLRRSDWEKKKEAHCGALLGTYVRFCPGAPSNSSWDGKTGPGAIFTHVMWAQLLPAPVAKPLNWPLTSFPSFYFIGMSELIFPRAGQTHRHGLFWNYTVKWFVSSLPWLSCGLLLLIPDVQLNSMLLLIFFQPFSVLFKYCQFALVIWI